MAGIVHAATSSHHTASPAHRAAAAGTPAAAATAGSTASAASSPASTASAKPAAVPSFGLVGAGGVTPREATGKLAVTGSIGDVLFAEDGTALDRNARQVVTGAARAIGQHQVATVTVIGCTDAIGNPAVNQRLSLARAVIAALRTRVGGTSVRYHAQARGQAKPVAANSTAAGRQLNRRVVITTGWLHRPRARGRGDHSSR